MGLSYKAQYLAEFVSYSAHVTIVTIGIQLAIHMGGLFPQSMDNSKFLMFFFQWIQGISNFGFIVMIVNLLPHNMYPKLAAKWGSLIYFSSSFFDFTIQKIGIAESTKVLMSMAFPTLSVARASRNLAVHEYTPGGEGLDYNHTLFDPYHNYRIITYFGVMVYALVFHFMIGMLFEKYGSVPEIIRNVAKFFRGNNKEAWELTGSDPSRQLLKEIDINNFETEEDKNLVRNRQLAEAPQSQAKMTEDILEIHNLVKKFKQVNGAEGEYLTAVDHLSIKMHSG
jgi:hypothetical protein